MLTHLALAASCGVAAAVFAGNALLGFLNGSKWPVIESYVGAGRGPTATARAIGLFNIAWALPVPLALLFAGPAIGSSWPQALFVIPALVNATSLILVRRLPAVPEHLPADHPQRPAPDVMKRLVNLLGGSQLLLFISFATMWILAAVMPAIFEKRLGQTVGWSSGLSCLVDAMRLAAFVALFLWSGWHFRLRWLAAAMLVLPAGFFMVLMGADLATVLGGEVLFGVAAGLIYYSAMYYAMVVHNAAVHAGGMTEGTVGMGFAAGPAAGLVGLAMEHVLHGRQIGMLLVIVPLLVLSYAVVTVRLSSAKTKQPSADFADDRR